MITGCEDRTITRRHRWIGYKRPLAKGEHVLMTRLIGTSVDDIRDAARLVLEGGLVAYPTDTVYGLGGNAVDVDAVGRLVKATQRVKGSVLNVVSFFAKAEA